MSYKNPRREGPHCPLACSPRFITLKRNISTLREARRVYIYTYIRHAVISANDRSPDSAARGKLKNRRYREHCAAAYIEHAQGSALDIRCGRAINDFLARYRAGVCREKHLAEKRKGRKRRRKGNKFSREDERESRERYTQGERERSHAREAGERGSF